MPDTLLTVRVKPGAKRADIALLPDGALRIAVRAPALEGRANRAVLELLADALGLAPSRVQIVRGASSRTKIVAVGGLSTEECQVRIASWCQAVRKSGR